MQTCPYCKKENPDTEAYCYACGHILPRTLEEMYGATNKLEDVYETLEPKRRWGTAYFDQRNRLQLIFRDGDDTLTLELSGELVLGRHRKRRLTPPSGAGPRPRHDRGDRSGQRQQHLFERPTAHSLRGPYSA
jgi:hypothetical protein